MLDPQILYEGLKVDYADDSMLSKHLKKLKSDLFEYFHNNYMHIVVSTPSVLSSPVQTQPTVVSPQKSFTAQYHQKDKPAVNELEEYFRLPAKDFDMCNPIHWWMGQQAQFPNLFCLACDILSIPGKLLIKFWMLCSYLVPRFCCSF